MLGTLIESVSCWRTVGVLVVTYLTYRIYRSIHRPHGLPPGPNCIPFLGNVLMLRKRPPYIIFKEIAKEYGDVFTFKLVSKWVVVLNNIDVVREALLRKQDQFAGRFQSFSIELATDGYKDIAFSPFSERWKLHRKLGHTALRQFATGKNLEKLVFSMTSKLDTALEAKGDEPFDPKDMICNVVFNILASLCFGHDYAYDDPRVQHHIDLFKEQYESIGNGLVTDYIKFLRHFNLPEVARFKELMARYFAPIKREFAEHKESFDPDNIRDLIDSLFKAQQDAIEEGSANVDSLTDTHLVQTVGDIFGAGTETTILTFQYALALLCEHPEVQAKVAEECDRVIGRERLPSLDDRGKLPYSEATLYEVFRYASVTPLGIPHTTTEDVTLCGYDIPKDTWVIVNHWGLHNDEAFWEKPSEFKPEHFLDEDGQVRQHPNSFLPFSVGRRACLGESFAKAETFLLFTWLFQHYTFSKVPGEDVQGNLYDVDEGFPMARQPKPFKLVCKKRF